MSGKKIIDGLRDAAAGNFSRVTIEGQTWVRHRPAMTVNAQTMLELADKLEPQQYATGIAFTYLEFRMVIDALRFAALAPSQEEPTQSRIKLLGNSLDAAEKLATVLRRSVHKVITEVDASVWCPENERVLYAVQLTQCDIDLIGDALAALNQPQRMWSAPAEFVMWALMEGAWQGDDVDGGASQDKAVELGLIVATQYDPEKHGETAYCEPGDQWFVPSESLLAALAGKPGAEPQRPGDALRLLADLFSESLHETWTRGEIVSVIEDAIRLGSPHARPDSNDTENKEGGAA